MDENLNQVIQALSSGNDDQAELAVSSFHSLSEIQSVQLINLLQGLLADPQEDVRWWAARGIAELPGPAATALLCGALQDPAPTVRQCAALGLGQIMDASSIDDLIQRLDDPDPTTAALSANALEKMGEPAVPALIETARSSSHFVRLLAVRTLARIGDQRSIPTLFSALEDNSALLDYWASEGLEHMGVGLMVFLPE